MRTYHIAWWNLENLFDEEDAVALGRRTDKVFRAIKDDIKRIGRHNCGIARLRTGSLLTVSSKE